MTGLSTGRQDYDSLFTQGGLAPGEPVFIIRGRDRVAGDAIRAYADLAYQVGAPAEALELALQQADAVDRWPNKKIPDGPRLDENERKQLRNALGRRAWTFRAVIESQFPLLADKLAADAIAAKVRPAITAMIGRLTPAERQDALADETHPLHDLCRLAGWDLAGRIAAA